MLNFQSIYQKHSGTKLPWLAGDNPKRYEKNLTSQRDLLACNGWIGRYFDYQLNSHGFRSSEFTNDDTVMFLGCSLTCGIGLPVDVIWPELVSRHLGMNCANLGQGGCSADTAFRLCLGWIDRIKPRMVIYMKPPGIRWELVNQQTITSIRASTYQMDSLLVTLIPYIEHYIIDNNNGYFNNIKNTLAIESICRERGIKTLVFEPLQAITAQDCARDCMHPGVESHRQFAQQVIKEINHG